MLYKINLKCIFSLKSVFFKKKNLKTCLFDGDFMKRFYDMFSSDSSKRF